MKTAAVAYRIATPDAPPEPLHCDWDAAPWNGLPAHTLGHSLLNRPGPFPRVDVRLAWDADAVYVVFRVEDCCVRAVTTDDMGPVCQDSCVEFFFDPDPGGDDEGYFNLETNCIGTKLITLCRAAGKAPLAPADLARIGVVASLGGRGRIDPAIPGPLTWTVASRVPLAVLKNYRSVSDPAPGAAWRINLYKCGDRTPAPHWLCWSPIPEGKPSYHRPECFGRLVFDAGAAGAAAPDQGVG